MRALLKPFILAAGVLAIASASSAFAATNHHKDMTVMKDRYKDPVCPSLQKLKSGWYVGAQAGYHVYRIRQRINTPSTSSILASPATSMLGWAGGLTLGYGYDLSEKYYMGAEVFGNFSNGEIETSYNDGTVTYNSKINADHNVGFGLLPGMRLNDAALGYLRLAWNWTEMKATETISGGARAVKRSTSNGFLLGIGIEALIYNDWSIRTEYNHSFLSSFRTDFGSKYSPADNMFNLGLIYHIN
jgi:opacity protein-like surface antigen